MPVFPEFRSKQNGMRRMLAAGSCLLLIIVLCNSWGFLVHRTTQQLAVYELPRTLQSFFYSNMGYVVKYSVRPDQRRNEDSTEATKHFIDLEMFGDSAAWKMPYNWNEAVAKYSKDSLLKYGYVPYYIIIMKDRLTNAFRSGNKDSILFYATDLAHYIGDANVPLHVSVNYDGQLSNQKGLHSLWESVIPEVELEQFNLYSRHKARYLQHPEEAIWNAIRRSQSLLKDVFEQEKETSKSFTDSTKYRVQVRNGRESRSYTAAFAKAYRARLGNTINEQLIRSSDLIADFWYTSWVDAGKPDVKQWIQPAFSKENKQALKKECKAFRHNGLIKQKLLIAKQNVSE
jgi:S1/P1 Nuclease